MIINYTPLDLKPYINWTFFYLAWRVPPKSDEATQLRQDAEELLNEWNPLTRIRTIFRLCQAYADGDNLLIEQVRIPLLRQQTPHADQSPYLCLSDFIKPIGSDEPDTVGVFAVTCETDTEQLYADDPYRKLMAQSLADRLAEAGTEKMHQYVRRTAWGYAPHENLSISELLKERYQGIRPAVGYPSLPDQSVSFLLHQLLPVEEIGITFTENGAMHPHASVCGLMLAHPASRYFMVGKIGEDQLEDYARRRGMTTDKMRKFLAANL
ncbi:MAG: 5-methyltetrahydrofolate--homocysteine methyltransferase [Prevotellaceae bacterium]|jgi:cobalamin-dependent methionine synthase I|nr:5-methyltetrahydrofolate--homocysteine methyltransferase [Prevotellaceae bacterium]